MSNKSKSRIFYAAILSLAVITLTGKAAQGSEPAAPLLEQIRNEFICVETGLSIAESEQEGALCPTGIKVLDIVTLMMNSGWSLEKIDSYMNLFPQGESVIASVDINGQSFSGNPDAPVTMIEFTDMQCPFCGRFNSGSFPTIKKDYIDSGKVRYVLVNLPLGFHLYAKKAAEALYCAGDQEKIWELRNAIFDNQSNLSVEAIKEYAKTIIPNAQQFNQCLDTEKYAKKINEDIAKSQDAGINGTPGFIIGKSTSTGIIRGRKVSGAQPAEAFTSVIDSILGAGSVK